MAATTGSRDTHDLVRRALRRMAGLHVIGQRDLRAGMAAVLLRFALVNVVFVAAMVLRADTPRPLQLGGLLALAALAAWWIALEGDARRSSVPLIALEGLALLVVGVALGIAPLMLGLMYVALQYRALSGSVRTAITVGVVYVVAHIGAVLAITSLVADPLVGATSPLVLAQIPGFALSVFAMRVVVIGTEQRDEGLRRQGVLTDTAVALGAAENACEVAGALRAGVLTLLDVHDTDPAAAHVLVSVEGDQGPMVVAAEELAHLGRPLPDPPPGDVLSLAAGDRVLGHLVVPEVSADDLGGLESMAAQAALALARVEAAGDLRANEARFRALVGSSKDVMRVVDDQGVIRFESEAVRRVLGYAPEDLVGRSALELVHPDDRDRHRSLLATLEQRPGSTVVVDALMRHADGTWRHVEGSVQNLVGDPAVGGYVVNYRDVTERKELEERLNHQALHDPLTGLPNRILFADRAAHALELSHRTGTAVAVVLLDLDDFRTVNDVMGHAAGDAVLEAVARRLEIVLRAPDTSARLGGDEFAVLLEGLSSAQEAIEVASRLVEVVEQPLAVQDEILNVGASIGIAVAHDQQSAEELIRQADLAMHRAKANPGGAPQVFEPSMLIAIEDRISLRADLERAIEADELVPYYQPIVEMPAGRIVGVEALVRWEHPERGLLLPAEFVPFAEENGLIVPIGRRVLAKACRDVASWRRSRGIRLDLAVNLSAPELLDPDLRENVAKVLSNTSAPVRLVLEVTESVLFQDMAATADALRGLISTGARIALDDFGTGYSSLSHLHRFPVDIVKIDRSFVAGLGEPGRESPLAEAILALGRTLGLEVVAEGVEGSAQLDRLAELGCVHAQGFLFAPALPAAQVEMLLDAGGIGLVPEPPPGDAESPDAEASTLEDTGASRH